MTTKFITKVPTGIFIECECLSEILYLDAAKNSNEFFLQYFGNNYDKHCKQPDFIFRTPFYLAVFVSLLKLALSSERPKSGEAVSIGIVVDDFAAPQECLEIELDEHGFIYIRKRDFNFKKFYQKYKNKTIDYAAKKCRSSWDIILSKENCEKFVQAIKDLAVKIV